MARIGILVNRGALVVNSFRWISTSSAKRTMGPDITLVKINQVGLITLNRPAKLNALNYSIIDGLHEYFDDCESDNEIRAIVIKGSGKAFCAGDDIKSIRQEAIFKENKRLVQLCKRMEFEYNNKIAKCKKPYIALCDGITMGSGVGLSIHGSYLIATENTIFAMPETAIGYFVDVGASYFLSRLKNNVGLYMALTGARLKGSDLKRIGIATHYIQSGHLSELEEELFQSDNLTTTTIEDILTKFDEKVEGEFESDKIASIFSYSNLEDIVDALKQDASEWSKEQLMSLEKRSPTSLKVTMRQMSLVKTMNFKDCLKMEYQLSQRFLTDSDFLEGIRARLIDKDTPKWKPASIKMVDDKKIDWFFKENNNDDKLNI